MQDNPFLRAASPAYDRKADRERLKNESVRCKRVRARPNVHARRQQARSSACSARTARRAAPSPRCPSGGRAPGPTISGSRAWRMRPASISCCRSGAGRAMAARPTTKAPRSRPSPGRPPAGRDQADHLFGTVHAPLFHPIIAAKQIVTADQIGEGRFGLNIVVGWNEDEFEMFGVEQRDHDGALRLCAGMDRRHQADLVRARGLRFRRPLHQLKAVRAKPKPYGGSRPIIMNAGASPTGQAFAVKNCDAFFMQASRVSVGGDRGAGRRGQAAGAAARARDQRLHRRCHHLPADDAGGGGLPPILRGRSGRLGGRRPAARDAQYHPADRAGRRVRRAAQPVRPRQQRSADHRRSRSRGAATRRPEFLPVSPALPCRSSTTPTSCLTSASKCCRGSSGRDCGRIGKPLGSTAVRAGSCFVF